MEANSDQQAPSSKAVPFLKQQLCNSGNKDISPAYNPEAKTNRESQLPAATSYHSAILSNYRHNLQETIIHSFQQSAQESHHPNSYHTLQQSYMDQSFNLPSTTTLGLVPNHYLHHNNHNYNLHYYNNNNNNYNNYHYNNNKINNNDIKVPNSI